MQISKDLKTRKVIFKEKEKSPIYITEKQAERLRESISSRDSWIEIDGCGFGWQEVRFIQEISNEERSKFIKSKFEYVHDRAIALLPNGETLLRCERKTNDGEILFIFFAFADKKGKFNAYKDAECTEFVGKFNHLINIK